MPWGSTPTPPISSRSGARSLLPLPSSSSYRSGLYSNRSNTLEGCSVKLLHWPFVCAFALSSIPSLAPADEPTIAERAQLRVETALVKPLAERENNRFSRARPYPQEQRVRITNST